MPRAAHQEAVDTPKPKVWPDSGPRVYRPPDPNEVIIDVPTPFLGPMPRRAPPPKFFPDGLGDTQPVIDVPRDTAPARAFAV
jgi:hypothetical protein